MIDEKDIAEFADLHERAKVALSLVPVRWDAASLARLRDEAERAAAADPERAARRAAGQAVGLRVCFEVDPEDVDDLIAGRRLDLKTWFVVPGDGE